MACPHANLPSVFGSGYLRKNLADWNSPYGSALRRGGEEFFLGVPSPYLFGLSSGASATDNTTVGVPDQPFHEMGPRQTTGGPRSGPAPNPNPRAPHNAWGRHAHDEPVVRLLGRPAVMTPDGWKTAPADQAIVGLAAEAADLREILLPVDPRHPGYLRLDPRIHPTRMDTPYALFLSNTGFSTGADGAIRLANRWAPCIVQRPEREWLTALVECAALDFQHGENLGSRLLKHSNPAYTILRGLQKLHAGRALADALQPPTLENPPWFVPPPVWAERAVANGAHGCVPASAFSAGTAVVGVGLGVAAKLAWDEWGPT